MKSGIYKITSPTGRIYIGQSIDLDIRRKYYTYRMCKNQKRLHASILKYGWINHNFEIVEYCVPLVLNDRERYWQDFYEVLGKNGLNCVLVNSTNCKRVISNETRQKISLAGTGKKLSPETKKKLSQALKALPYDEMRYLQFLANRVDNTGKKMSVESNKKLSNAKKGKPALNKGIPATDQHKLNVSNSRKGKYTGSSNHVSKLVFDTLTGVFYDTMNEAAKARNYNPKNLSRNLNGAYVKNKTPLLYV